MNFVNYITYMYCKCKCIHFAKGPTAVAVVYMIITYMKKTNLYESKKSNINYF